MLTTIALRPDLKGRAENEKQTESGQASSIGAAGEGETGPER